jgi:hypothetical protein
MAELLLQRAEPVKLRTYSICVMTDMDDGEAKQYIMLGCAYIPCIPAIGDLNTRLLRLPHEAHAVQQPWTSQDGPDRTGRDADLWPDRPGRVGLSDTRNRQAGGGVTARDRTQPV